MNVDFEKFWTLFRADFEFEGEKERCAAIWSQMSTPWREDILHSLREYNARPNSANLRARKSNPRYYLTDYNPTSLRLAPKGTEVSFATYYKFYQTTLEEDGWKRVHLEDQQKTIYVKQ